jgi:hypothetical protein
MKPITFGLMKPRIAHVVNPYQAPAGSDAERIQNVTLRSLADAVEFCADADVDMLAAVFEQDTAAVPGGIRCTPFLEESVLDHGSFTRQVRYPLIAEVLQRAFDTSDAEFIIYTNMDIIVQPYFYRAVTQLLRNGADAVIINRRRIADHGQGPDDLPMILAEVGRSHPGFDCFVMQRSLIPRLRLDGICLGVPFVEAALLYNLLAFAENCEIRPDLHLTTHLGLEVMPDRDTEYHRHNKACFERILPSLKPFLAGKNLPYSELGIVERTLKRGLNPAVFTGLHLELEQRSFFARMKLRWNELRFRMLHR